MTSSFSFSGLPGAVRAAGAACAACLLIAGCGGGGDGGGGSPALAAMLPVAPAASGDGAATRQAPIVAAPMPGDCAQAGGDAPRPNSKLDCAP
ncbi:MULTISPECIES: hypothetical protein [unclassified Variovorax]|uniref:hypothetical protein n=1 Tax=unclassified Variovorax TaxID=663243 RepID=UPI00131CCAFD|nr:MULTISPECIES: hypothetical protein [unclassified Variovorax]QRY35370.1 hypothetical protein JVX96_28990 [Variovorax sp. PDNC026]